MPRLFIVLAAVALTTGAGQTSAFAGLIVPPAVVSPISAATRSSLGEHHADQDAQDASPMQPDIVVEASRPPGSVVGDIPPDRTLKPADILAYGVDSVDDLINALGAQVASGRGRDDDGPVVLLNGRRVSSYAEIARLPTEAIERLELLPEEVALKYGYRADQKVVNVVVLERYNSQIGKVFLSAPTEGGQISEGATANYVRIHGNVRFNIDGQYSKSGNLLESERSLHIIDGNPSLGRSRTLLPTSRQLDLTSTIAGPLLKDVPATLNLRYDDQKSRRLLGIGEIGTLAASTDSQRAHVGTIVSGGIGKWQWYSNGNYDRIKTTTLIDTGDPMIRRNQAQSVNSLANIDLLISGSVFTMPAGPIFTSVKGTIDFNHFDSRSRIDRVSDRTSLSRKRGAVQANLDVPIADRDTPGLGWLGRLTASTNLLAEHFSDVGTLATYGFGLNWSLVPALGLRVSTTDEEGSPTVEQLGAPLIVTPNLLVFDPAIRDTVAVTQITGSNRELRPDRRRVFSLGMTAKPFTKADLTISIDYVDIRIDNPIEAFPILTPAIVAAFPDRISRTSDGRITQIDATPINFARSEQRQLRSRLSFSRVFGAVPPGFEGGAVRFVPGDADLRMTSPGNFEAIPKPGSAFERNLETVNSRVFLNIQQIWRLTDDVLVRRGGLLLDLLRGDALNSTGGRPRHEVEAQAGVAKRGLGGNMTANWRSGTSVRGLGATGDLFFDSYATVNLSLFANLGARLGVKGPRWTKGLRVNLAAVNLFNRRPNVRDAAGITPLVYQPPYLDPLGRTFAFSLRKLF